MADSLDSATAPKIHSDTQVVDRWSEEFEAAHAAYSQAEARLSLAQKNGVRVTDRQIAKNLDERDAALWNLIRARTPNKWMLIEKIHLLLRLMLDQDWTDRRDLVLAASILRDIEQWEPES